MREEMMAGGSEQTVRVGGREGVRVGESEEGRV